MPIFFLDVFNTEAQAKDEEGQDLPDLDAARRAAIRNIRSILMAEVARGKMDLRGEIRIEDEQGDIVLVVPYGQAVEIVTDPQGRAH